MKTIEEIKDYLEDLSENDLAQLWNTYCENVNYYDDTIYDMDELDELLSGDSPSELATKIYYGEFCPNDHYFTFNGCGNLESGYADELISIEDMARYILENEDYLDDDDLEEFCTENEEE